MKNSGVLRRAYIQAALYSVGGVSLLFVGLTLLLVAAIAPNGALAAISIGLGYFFALGIWILVFAERAGRKAKENKLVGLVFAVAGVLFSVFVTWIVGLTVTPAGGPTSYVETLITGLPTLGLLAFFAVPMGLLSGMLFIGQAQAQTAITQSNPGL